MNIQLDKLAETERGAGGFGSTGKVSRMCIAAQIILVAGAVIVAFFGVIGFGPNFKK